MQWLMSCMDVEDKVVMQGIFSTSLLREAESGEYCHNLQREWGEGNAEKRIKTPHHYRSEKISHFLPLLQFLDINVRFRLLCIPNLICIESSLAGTFILLLNGISSLSLSVQLWLITNRKKWIMWQNLQKYIMIWKYDQKHCEDQIQDFFQPEVFCQPGIYLK